MTGQHSYEQTLPTGFKLVGGLHNYIVEQVLGQGGFGITYKVKTRIKTGNIGIDAYFAVKEFFPSGCWRNPGSTEMQYAPTSRKEVEACLKDFITEGQRLQQMCQLNTNIVNVNEVFEANGTAYFVMEYLDGGDIRQMVRNNGGPLSEKTMLSILTPIADAVRTLHYNNMLHLDIKPENIVMRKGYDDTPDVPVLIDFGIAVHFSEDGSPTTTRPSKGVTQGYSPIEQFAGITRFDPRIDIYALSATAYFMLAGKDPRSAFDITSQEISNSLVGRASQNTINALLHGMSQHYSYRTTTVDELLAELMPPVNPIMPESFDDPDTSDYTTRGFDMQGSYDNDVNQAYSGMTAYEAIPAAQPRDKGKKRKTILITAAIVGAALIGLAIWGIISTSKGNNDKKLEALLNDTTFSQELLEFAENGNDEAQNILAFCYKDGKGVTKDSIKAVEWWKKAAEQNNAEAQHRLGHAYQDGNGVEKDLKKAFEWFQKAAEQNHPRALCDLAICYENGEGVEKNQSKAIDLFRKSAELGDDHGQFCLGYRYHFGIGVEKDLSKAIELYKKAIAQGNDAALNNLGLCYKLGEGVEKDLNKAVELFRKSAEKSNNPEAQSNLGDCYYEGIGVNKDLKQAVEWYRKAAEQGDAYSQNSLGYCYENGLGVSKDLSKAVEWYKKAAEKGNSFAQNNLGNCYYYGTGVKKDYKQAVEWYKKAAAQGDADAQYSLGWAYENGEGITKDKTQAVAWYRKAAAQGHADAKTALKELGYK